MRRTLVPVVASLALAVALAGCGQKAEQAATTSADSLLAQNPVESPQGELTPQPEAAQPEPEATPTPTPSTSSSKPKAPKPSTKPAPAPAPAQKPGVTIPAGTPIKIAVNAQISSEFVHEGDAWEGSVTSPVVIGTAAPIPAGSKVRGVIRGAAPAEKGSRAFLYLAVTSIEVNGQSHEIGASADSIIAGSTRARNLGAIAGGAAAGALIGKAVGGSGKGALIGGLIGGAAAGAGVAGSKGYQVVLKEGTELVFSTREAEVIHE